MTRIKSVTVKYDRKGLAREYQRYVDDGDGAWTLATFSPAGLVFAGHEVVAIRFERRA